ncbi:MAG: archease [Pirellulales bacterium]
MYERFEHTADIGLRIRAGDLDSLFAEAARAMFSVIVANLADVRPVLSLSFTIEGQKYDDLLLDWLAELLSTFDARRVLLAEFDVRIDASGLKATARGEPLDPSRHRLEEEIKAVTYHRLKVERQADGWLAEVLVDV